MVPQLQAVNTTHTRGARLLRRDVFWAGLGLFVAASFHFFYFLVDPEHIAPDTPSYLGPAYSILEGRGFLGSGGLPETMRTPGYPLFLATCMLLGMETSGVGILQHLLLAALAFGIYYLARTIGAPKGLAFLANILYGIDFPSLQAANRVLTEVLFTLILFFVGWVAVRWTKEGCDVRPAGAALAGFLGGLSALVRPISVFYILPLGVVLWLSAKEKRIVNLVVLTICFSVLPLAWALRNQKEAGLFSLSSITGESLLFWRAAGALAMGERGDFDTMRAFHAKRLRNIALERLADSSPGRTDPTPHAKKAEVYSNLAKEILLGHLWNTLMLTIRGVGAAIFGGGGVPISRLTGLPYNSAKIAGSVWSVVCFLCFVIGIRTLWKENWRTGLLLLVTIGYFVLIPAGGEGYSRFRVPVVPFYVVGIAFGIGKIIPSLRRNLGRSDGLG